MSAVTLTADLVAQTLVAAVKAASLHPRVLLEPLVGHRCPNGLMPARAAAFVALRPLVAGKGKSLRDKLFPGLSILYAGQMVSPSTWRASKVYQDCLKAAMEVVHPAYLVKVAAIVELQTPPIVTISHISKHSAVMVARQLSTLRAAKAPQDGLGTGPVAVAPPAKPECVTLTVPARQFGKTEADRLERQKSWAPSPVDLPPIPPVVCGTKWTREYIEERERILALHRQAGRKVPS